MKKGLKYLLVSALALPFVANADMAAPAFRGYDAVVTKSEGIKICDGGYPEKCVELKNGEKFQITSVYDDLEGSVDNSIYYDVSYNGFSAYFIKLDTNSFRTLTDEVKPTDKGIVKLTKAYKIRTLKEVELRKGPGKVYELIDKIPANTELTYMYVDDAEGYAEDHDDVDFLSKVATSIYVEYNGKAGWINVLHEAVLFKENFYSFVFRDLDSECGKIKKGEFIKGIGKLDAWSKLDVYVKDKCEFKASDRANYELSRIYPQYAKALKDIKVYDDTKNGKVVKTIKKGEEFVTIVIADEDLGDSAPASVVYYDGVIGYAHFEYSNQSPYNIIDFETIKDKEVDYSLLGLEKLTDEPITTIGETKTDKKSDKNDTTLYILIGVVVGSLLIIGGLVIALLKKKKAQE